jgi:uncharacterized protein (TIGR02271 family)
MATAQRSTVVAVFNNSHQADRAVAELRRAGFRDDQIGYLMRNEDASVTTKEKDEGDTYAGTGAATGVVAGGVLGGLAGAVAAGLIPGVGPFVAAGILAATLGGAAAGAAAGGIVGALIGMGIPEEEAHYYESEFRAGRIIVTVRADGRYDEAWDILRRHGAYNQSTAEVGATAGTTGGQTMRVHEEELRAVKQPVQAGEVKVRKEVHTEQKTVQVPVEREEVVIERHPVGERPASAADIKPGQEIRIPVKEEQVRVEKQPVVKEEVTVGKRKVQDTEQVSGTVRKEEVKVEQKGDVDVRSKGTTPKDQGRGKK